MSTRVSRNPMALQALLILGGPAVVGLCMGLRHGPEVWFKTSLLLPAVLLGVGAMMIPALYIGASFLGAAPRARVAGLATLAAVRSTGLILLGFSAPLAFLMSTSDSALARQALALAAVALAVLLGLKILHKHFFEETGQRLAVSGLYLFWSAVSLAIGLQLLTSAMEATI